MSGDEKQCCRLWSIATKTCLVLTVKNNKVESVTCKESAREDKPEESSIVKIEEAYDAGPDAICWRIVFTLNNKEYALHVDNNIVTALEVNDKNASKKATCFVPKKQFGSEPFAAWEVFSGPSQGKFIAVNEEGRLTVQAFDFTPCRMSTTFVKI